MAPVHTLRIACDLSKSAVLVFVRFKAILLKVSADFEQLKSQIFNELPKHKKNLWHLLRDFSPKIRSLHHHKRRPL